ncbi:MAG: hypothetical protein ACYC3L_02165 [Gemmatimonadaceae bacterium]
MRFRPSACLLAALAAAPFSAPLSTPLSAQLFGGTTLNIVADPATATIYRLRSQDNVFVPIGTGNAKFKLEKNDPNTILVSQEGYREVRRSFSRDADYKDKNVIVILDKRVVKLTAQPYDARVYENGVQIFGKAADQGKGNLEIEVGVGQTTTIEVKKVKYATVKRVYRWEKGGELPPVADRVELVDRAVEVTTMPPKAELLSDGAKIGDGDGVFVIKRGTCGTLTASLPGFIPASQTWCNKDGDPSDPPSSFRLVLTGRVVNLTAPPAARIVINNTPVGVGSFQVQVKDGSCVDVDIAQPGFLTEHRKWCAAVPNWTQDPPRDENVTLAPDDSYAASMASDQANVNVTLEVGKSFTEEAAWRLLASIVLNHFDVLENSDAQTGYLRTAWQVKSYGDNRVLVRTRVIVKRSNDQPLRYTIKIVSERNDSIDPKVKDDEKFTSWDRVLNVYKDVISEAQSRLAGR